MKYFSGLLICLLFEVCFSAPHPTTGQSLINRLSSGPVFSQFGFQLKGQVELPWIMDASEDDAKEFNLLYGSGRLNIKTETVSAKTELGNYIKRFLKDYNHYGFSISKIQNGSDESTPQITLDIEQKNKKNKLKQYFILKNQHVLTITCTDDVESFERTSHLCQRFIDEISWL
jgi:hypothetical protein